MELQKQPCPLFASEPPARLRPLPIRAHLVLQLLPAALHCAAQAALLRLLLVSNLAIADGDFGFVSWGCAGVAHQTL